MAGQVAYSFATALMPIRAAWQNHLTTLELCWLLLHCGEDSPTGRKKNNALSETIKNHTISLTKLRIFFNGFVGRAPSASMLWRVGAIGVLSRPMDR